MGKRRNPRRKRRLLNELDPTVLQCVRCHKWTSLENGIKHSSGFKCHVCSGKRRNKADWWFPPRWQREDEEKSYSHQDNKRLARDTKHRGRV